MTSLTEHHQPAAGSAPPSHRSWRHRALAHPLALFVALAYLLSWTAWVIAYVGGGLPLVVVGAFGPAVAAALVTFWTGGSIRAWLQPLFKWRVPLRFYLYALGLPMLLFGLMNVALALLGTDIDIGHLSEAVPAYIATLLFVAVLGGGQEEPGWRGFALDRFQAQHSPIVATLLLGVVWGMWHLPLYGLGAVGPMMFVFFYTWLYNRTRSVLLCVLLHASFTPALEQLILAEDSLTVDVTIVATMLGAVVALIALTRGRLGLPVPSAT